MTPSQRARFRDLSDKQKHRGDPLDAAEQAEHEMLQTIARTKWPEGWDQPMAGPLWSPENPFRGHIIIGKENAFGDMIGIACNTLAGEFTWR